MRWSVAASYNPLIATDVVVRRAGGDQSFVLLDCRFDMMRPSWGEEEYRSAHIPGARYAHLERDLSGPVTPSTGRHPLPSREAWLAKVRSWGISADTHVVVYDESKGQFAARAWWMLRWLGIQNVSLLDGGCKAWAYARAPVTIHVPKPVATTLEVAAPLVNLVTTEQVVKNLSEGWMLLDARAPERFSGLVETLDNVAGHVPGARNYPFVGSVGLDSKLRPARELRQRFTEMFGQIPPDRVMHMCGSGVTSCLNVLSMEVAGLPGSALYAGSWSEWIRVPARPVAKGSV